jgi:fibrillarin-like pre-rRNA processing protein
MENVYCVQQQNENMRLATMNLTPGHRVYGERIVNVADNEYRIWDPYKSKLAAAILNNLPELPIKSGSIVLYLGAATGTTVSHISDIVGRTGRIYALEFSIRALRELISNVFQRMNLFPLFADVRFPTRYRALLENVDVVYCDVAQPKQAQILADNVDVYLKAKGSSLLTIKARSIDSVRNPELVFKEQIHALKLRRFHIRAKIPLMPYDKDHLMVWVESQLDSAFKPHNV